MEINNWKTYYNKIMNDFKFNKEDDLKSAYILKDIINKEQNNISTDILKKIIENKEIYIFGAGPSLKKHINQYLKEINNSKNKQNDKITVVIAADGATKALLEKNIIPDIIVSDLDGDLNSIYYCNNKGSIIVIHAHGDNINLIKEHTPKLKNIMGSYQYPIEIENLINYGGFTDGDRCCFLAEKFNGKKLILGGMDFGEYITKYSRPNIKNEVEKGDEIKIKKLKYGEELVKWLKENGNCKIEFMK